MVLHKFMVRTGRTRVYFGPESMSELNEWIKNFDRVFIITGKKSAKITGALDDVLSILSNHNIKYELFDKVFPNPTASLVNEASEHAWRFGADAVIAIGGGSVIDTAKLVSIIVKCGGRAEDYVRSVRKAFDSIPLAAINLTHGTGSEVDRYAVVTIEETHEKVGVASEYMYPSISIDEPKYLTTLPRNQTVYTALDAFYHAIESATSNASSPYTLMLSEEAVRLIVKWLPIALNEPKNIEARYWLLYASMIAGISIDHGRTHIVHAVEHALSGLKPRLAHGAGLAIIGPQAIKYIYESVPDKMYRLLRYIDPELEPKSEHADKAAKAITKFQQSIGFSEKLRDYGFRKEDFNEVSKLVFTAMKYILRLAPFNVNEVIVKDIFLKSL